MKRHEQYADPNANPYVASQMQSMYAQRMKLNAGIKNYPDRPESFTADNEHRYTSSKEEGHWQRDRDSQKASNQFPFHLSSEGQAGTGTRFFYQGQMLDPKLDSRKQENKETRVQTHEEDMEIGYEDNPSPLTFEGLEHKFLNEITKLVKEQSDAEDAENARHREKMMEINNQYQEKLLSLRARHGNRRDEYLHKESQARLHEFKQAGMNNYPNNSGLGDLHGFSGAAAASAAIGEARRGHAASQFDSYRERLQYPGTVRAQSTEGRIPYPSGRVYNSSTVYYPDIP